ncbi:MAG TPA: AAA family ATPase [Chitinophagaceae bacterium]|nr:AAA family ATPase [Chitinophagaceae bacterium]
MIFKVLTIKNFRGIRNCTISNLTRVTLILGKNNSGKSSILEAIFLLSGAGNPLFAVNVDNFRGLIHNENNDFRFIFYNLSEHSKIEIKGDQFDHTNFISLEISPKMRTSNSQIKTSTPNINTGLPNALTIDDKEPINGIDYSLKIKNHELIKEYSASIISEINANGLFTLNSKQALGYIQPFNSLLLFSYSRAGLEIAKLIEKIIIEKRMPDVIKILKVIDPKINNIFLGANNMIYFDKCLEQPIPFQLMGDGMLKLLQIIVNIEYASGGILLIDEIENGLHFSVIETLWNLIFTSAKIYDCQIFITSHNNEILKSLNLFLSKETGEAYRNEMGCYTLIKKDNDDVEALKYEYDQFEFVIENKIEIRGGN